MNQGQGVVTAPGAVQGDAEPNRRVTSTRLPAAERRRQILDVALEAFARSGYHDTSMNAIARDAGVTKPNNKN